MSKSISGVATWLKDWFYDKAQIDTKITNINNTLNTKVDQVSGKQLSSNDYTNEEKQKLNTLSPHPNTHSTGMIVNENALENLGERANSTQQSINMSINNKIADIITDVELVDMSEDDTGTVNLICADQEHNKEIGGIISWLTSWFDNEYSGQGHTHPEYERVTISELNSSTINSSKSPKRLNVFTYGPIKIFEFYFTTNSLASTSTTYNVLANPLGEALRPTMTYRQIITAASGSHVAALLTINTDGTITIAPYSANQVGTFVGVFCYI